MDPGGARPPGHDPVELAEWITGLAERAAVDVGGVEAIAAAVTTLSDGGDLPRELVEHARLLALGAYFDGRGDGAVGAGRRLARAGEALVKARSPGRHLRSIVQIGCVRSPWTTLAGMPLQTVAAQGVAGRIELLHEFAPAVRDLDGFSHVWVLSDLDRARGYDLEVVPFLDDRARSLFATRSPRRPNPIGLSLVRVVSVDGPSLLVEELDLLDGTPVLDVKPYVPLFDTRDTTEVGWFGEAAARVFDVRSDGRYADDPD